MAEILVIENNLILNVHIFFKLNSILYLILPISIVQESKIGTFFTNKVVINTFYLVACNLSI